MSGSMALGDFNGDGKLDIVVSNFSSNTVSVFLNRGDGTFADPIISPVQITAVGLGPLAVGDFNQDGKLDVVLATIAGTQADIVLLGKGDGTFVQLPPIPNSFGFAQARVADVNNDGHSDLITCNTSTISVYLGNGDGTFTSTDLPQPHDGPSNSPFPTVNGPFLAIVAADFNGDQKIDIVTIDYKADATNGDGALDFYAGNGDGTFQSPVSVELAPSFPSAVAEADFNNDGKPDLLVGFPNMAIVLVGNGDGTFQLPFSSRLAVYSETGIASFSNGMVLQTADFDLDGKPDALVGDYDLGIVTLVLNKGIGQVTKPSGSQFQFLLSPGVAAMAVGDLNGDGLPDIAVANSTTNQISIMLSIKH